MQKEPLTEEKAKLVKDINWMKNVIIAEKISAVVFLAGTVGAFLWMATRTNPNYGDEGFQSTVFSCFLFFVFSIIDLFREKSKYKKLKEKLEQF